jgi:hypothetical protein
MNLGDVVRACYAVQSEATIPIGCSVDYEDGVPSMTIAFSSGADADTYLEAMATKVAAPFCVESARSGMRSSLFLRIANSAARFDCATGKLVEVVAEEQQSVDPIEQATRQCAVIQSSPNLPATCRMDFIDGVPSLVVGFRDAREAERYAGLASETAQPFCQAAVASNTQAAVFLTAGQEFSRIECGTGEVVAGTLQEQVPPVQRAIRGCEAIRGSDAPVDCGMQNVNGVPSVIFGFRNQREANRYLGAASRLVAMPFCAAANVSQERASVYMLVGRARMRHYDCEVGMWGPWLDEYGNPIAQRSPSRSTSAPPSPPPADGPIFSPVVSGQ